MKLPIGCLLLALAVTACAPAADTTPAADTAPAATAAPAPGVDILAPANGDTVSMPLTVRLSATGLEVIPATGAREDGKGHHHLVIDGDVPVDSLPLPKPPVVIHMGDGASERVLETLAPGSHRIIAVFAWGDHVPMTGVRRDTVEFIVK